MERWPLMLYRRGGDVELQDGLYSTLVVPDEAAEAQALADGWHLTPADARAADEKPPEAPTADPGPSVVEPGQAPIPPDDAPPTRAELEQKARELGIDFDGRATDKRLAARIAEKLKG